jgi:hypothetical protein
MKPFCHNEDRRRNHLFRRTATALGCSALLALTACSRDEEPARAFPKGLGGPEAGAVDSAAPADTLAEFPEPASGSGATDSAPPPPRADSGWSVGVQRGAGSDRVAIQRGVRVARNEGFDRIVIDLGPDALPGWHVEYVDTPVRQCGSGEAVELGGDAWLAIRLEPAQVHDDAGRATVLERALQPALPNLLELRLICDFEAHVEWVAGLRSPQPVRVLRLREPSRLVIDVRHPQ